MRGKDMKMTKGKGKSAPMDMKCMGQMENCKGQKEMVSAMENGKKGMENSKNMKHK